MAWPILGVVLRAMAGGAARGGASRAGRAAVERQTRISRSMGDVAGGLVELGRIAQGGLQMNIQVVDEDGFMAALQSLAERGSNMQSVFQEIGSYLQSEVESNFESETAPDGTGWAGHSTATLLRRGAGAKKLRDRGHLYGSLSYSASHSQVAVGTNRAYARIHQMGGQAGRGRQVTIPARPFLGLNEENRQEIGRIVNDHITEGLRR